MSFKPEMVSADTAMMTDHEETVHHHYEEADGLVFIYCRLQIVESLSFTILLPHSLCCALNLIFNEWDPQFDMMLMLIQ